MAEKDVIKTKKAHDHDKKNIKKTSLASDISSEKKATVKNELKNKNIKVRKYRKAKVKNNLTKKSKKKINKQKSKINKRPTRRKAVNKVFTFDRYVKELKVDIKRDDLKPIKDIKFKEEEVKSKEFITSIEEESIKETKPAGEELVQEELIQEIKPVEEDKLVEEELIQEDNLIEEDELIEEKLAQEDELIDKDDLVEEDKLVEEELIQEDNLIEEDELVEETKQLKTKKRVGLHKIYDYMNDAFINNKFKKGLNLLLIKNFLIAYIIANFFYNKLNINSFSFYRMTFSDASLLALKIFLTFISAEIIYAFIVYLMNVLFYDNDISIKEIIATFGTGLLYVNIIYILTIIIFYKNDFCGFFLFLLAFALYLIMLVTTVNVVSVKNNNSKIYISILSFMGFVLVLMLFFPLISSQFLRILEIMF